jgi:O-antigen ligase
MILYYLLLFMSPFYRHPIFDHPVGPLTVVKMVGAACGVYAIFYLVSRGKVPAYFATRQAKLFLVLCVWALISGARTRFWMSAGDRAFSYVSFLVFFFVTLTVVDTPKKIWWSLMATFAGLAFGAVYMLREFQKYHSLYANLRPGYIVGDPNYYTLAALLILPVAYYWLIGLQKPFVRSAVFGMFVLVSAAVAFASSRGGLVGLAVGVVYLVWNSQNRMRNSLILFLLLALPMVLVPKSPLKRFLHPDYADERGSETRREAWLAGLKMVKARPLIGIGLGRFKPLLPLYARDPDLHQIAHNTYLEYASELGIPSLLIFIWIIGEVFRALRRATQMTTRSGDRFLHPLALGLQCGLLAYTVGAFFISAQYLKLFWIVAFLSIPLERLARERASKQETPIANAA